MYCREESSGDNGCKNKYGVEESYSSENTYHIVYVQENDGPPPQG